MLLSPLIPLKTGREQSLPSQAPDSVCECFETCQPADVLQSCQGDTLLVLRAALTGHFGLSGPRGCTDREVLEHVYSSRHWRGSSESPRAAQSPQPQWDAQVLAAGMSMALLGT